MHALHVCGQSSAEIQNENEKDCRWIQVVFISSTTKAYFTACHSRNMWMYDGTESKPNCSFSMAACGSYF